MRLVPAFGSARLVSGRRNSGNVETVKLMLKKICGCSMACEYRRYTSRVGPPETAFCRNPEIRQHRPCGLYTSNIASRVVELQQAKI